MTRTVIETTDEQLDELLTCGFEGGITYWATLEGYGVPPPHKGSDVITSESLSDLLLKRDGWVQLGDLEDEGKVHTLNREAINRGLNIFHELCPTHWAEWRRGECDAACGDSFVQCCLFGQVLYG